MNLAEIIAPVTNPRPMGRWELEGLAAREPRALAAAFDDLRARVFSEMRESDRALVHRRAVAMREAWCAQRRGTR